MRLENFTQRINPGNNVFEMEIQVPEYELWCPENPKLYRITASVEALSSIDETQSVSVFGIFVLKMGIFGSMGKDFFERI